MANHSKYDPKFIRLAGWLARDGKKNDEIASALDITRDTFQQWLKKYPELKESVSKGKDEFDNKVVDALHKSACGFEYEKVEIEVSTIKGNEFKKEKHTTMYYPPDPTAMIFWLVNRQPDKWKRNPSFVNFEQAKGEINELFKGMKESINKDKNSS